MNAAFHRYWTARLVSYAGDQIARTALLVAVFDRYGGTAVGFLLIAATVPRLFGPALGALADRYDQRRIIVVCDLSQAVLYTAIALLSPSLPVLLALVAAASVAATTFTPAGRSLLPDLVGRDRLGEANARLAVGVNTGLAAGPALGGVLLSVAGLTPTLLLDVLSFLVSAALVAGLRPLARRGATTAQPLRAVLRDGLGVVRTNQVVRAVAFGFLLMVTFAALDNVALVPLVQDGLGAGPVAVGLLTSAYGVGMVAGPLLIARRADRVRIDLILYASLLAIGTGTILTGLSFAVVAAVAAQALAGAGAGWHNVAADTLVQRHVPADRLGTVFGTIYFFPYAAEMLAYVAGAALLGAVGGRWLLVISGLGVTATLALVLPLLSGALSATRRAPGADTPAPALV
ncbi:MFS transporter [Actinoplanes sp. TBRC 11911]|uniref:MFS transporter n=1 Tax=Actinoplanes sp. TBRC 11911 TaxID=2729386 RepID=UPI00145CF2CD|nr:MFS transporter [Actinoplanes sp. TBRC 11911]NMO49774.1 MFS transporter [Actinoplanes sp. TBRC 11911]